MENYPACKVIMLISLFTADFDPLFDMFADLSHKRFSSDLDVIINGSFKNGKLRAQCS